MPASKFKFPSVEDLKNLDPKEVVVNHGEKLVLAVCALLFLLAVVSLFGGVAGGGSTGSEVERNIATLDDLLRQPVGERLPDDFSQQDPVRGMAISRKPLPNSDAWDTRSARVVEVVDRVTAIVGGAPGEIFVEALPNVEGTLVPRIVSVGLGHGWVFQGAKANQADVRQWQLGLIGRDQIEVTDKAADLQWAVLYLAVDLRAFAEEMDRRLRGLEGLIAEGRRAAEAEEDEKAEPGMERLDPLRERDRDDERQGERLSPLWMPLFKGFEVERQDLSAGSGWERIEVPAPVGPPATVRDAQRPRPLHWPREQPWPSAIAPLWEGGLAGFRSVVRCDPYPELAGRIRTVWAPEVLQSRRGRFPGGVFFVSNPDQLALLVEGLMREYLLARRKLSEIEAALGEKDLDPTRRAALRRDAILQRRTVDRPHGMGFRFVDTTVVPGRQYRYRLRLLVENPCQWLSEKSASKAVRSVTVLRSAVTPPSSVLSVWPNVEFWLTGVGAPGPDGRVEKASVEIHALHHGVWRVVRGRVHVGDGIAWRGRLRVVTFARPVAKPRPAAGVRRPVRGAFGHEADRRPREALPIGFPERRQPAPRPGSRQIVEELVTLDTGAVLVDLVPCRVLRPILAMRDVVDLDGTERKVRAFLRPTQFLLQSGHRMVYLDASGRVGAVLEGDIPAHAVARRKRYRKWLEGGLRDRLDKPPDRRRDDEDRDRGPRWDEDRDREPGWEPEVRREDAARFERERREEERRRAQERRREEKRRQEEREQEERRGEEGRRRVSSRRP